MPIVLSEKSSKKSIMTHPLSQTKAPVDNTSTNLISSGESDNDHSHSNLQQVNSLPSGSDKKSKIKDTEVPVFEDFLPSNAETLDNKVRWLVDRQLSKFRPHNKDALAKTPLFSSSSDASSSASEDDSNSDSSEISLPSKKMKKSTKSKKPVPTKKNLNPKKLKKLIVLLLLLHLLLKPNS